MEKTYICPFCGETIKLANPHHLKKCKGFNDFIEKNKNEIYELYYNQEWSMVESNSFLCPIGITVELIISPVIIPFIRIHCLFRCKYNHIFSVNQKRLFF